MIEYIYGPGGKIIGSLRKGGSNIRGERMDVFDSQQKHVGWIDDDGTFDETGYQISTSKNPGLLLRDSR